jgi:hypothetical protein
MLIQYKICPNLSKRLLTSDVELEKLCEAWDEQFIESGTFDVLSPQFEPLIGTAMNEHMWDKLIAKDINP